MRLKCLLVTRPPKRMMLEIAVDKRNSFRLNFCQAKLVHLTLLVFSQDSRKHILQVNIFKKAAVSTPQNLFKIHNIFHPFFSYQKVDLNFDFYWCLPLMLVVPSSKCRMGLACFLLDMVEPFFTNGPSLLSILIPLLISVLKLWLLTDRCS